MNEDVRRERLEMVPDLTSERGFTARPYQTSPEKESEESCDRRSLESDVHLYALISSLSLSVILFLSPPVSGGLRRRLNQAAPRTPPAPRGRGNGFHPR